MRSLSVSFIAVSLTATACACSTGSEPTGSLDQRDLGSLASMTACPPDNSNPQCPTGSFAVTCANGSTEVDSQQQIMSNDVCMPDSGSPASDAGTPPSEGGGATSDPFDPSSCPGPTVTPAEAAQFFESGATQAIIGSYAIEMRQRPCNAVTGCGAWGVPTTIIAGMLGATGPVRSLSGNIALNVQGSTIGLSLIDSTEELPEVMGANCGTVNGTPLQCSAYDYDFGDQWGGSGGLFPTTIDVDDVNSNSVTFGGVLTSTCLRLAYAAVDSNGNDVQEFVVLAQVAPSPPPPPNACPGGGNPMACGSQAAGETTCCQNGLTTCPSSGCDCWGACD